MAAFLAPLLESVIEAAETVFKQPNQVINIRIMYYVFSKTYFSYI